jgi:hypothetical protein
VRPWASGRRPFVAQTRRRIGLSPRRASSSAHTSTVLAGFCRRSAATWHAAASFPVLLLCRRRRAGVLRSGHLEAETQAAQPFPAGLLADRDAPTRAHIRGDLRSRPQTAIGRRLLNRRPQVDLLIAGEFVLAAVDRDATIAQPVGPVGVPTLQHRAHPPGGESDLRRHLRRRRRLLRPRQKPEDRSMCLLNPRATRPIAAGDLVVGQMRNDR